MAKVDKNYLDVNIINFGEIRGGRGDKTLICLETDLVISGPMKGLKQKKCIGNGHETNKKTVISTLDKLFKIYIKIC